MIHFPYHQKQANITNRISEIITDLFTFVWLKIYHKQYVITFIRVSQFHFHDYSYHKNKIAKYYILVSSCLESINYKTQCNKDSFLARRRNYLNDSSLKASNILPISHTIFIKNLYFSFVFKLVLFWVINLRLQALGSSVCTFVFEF